MQVYNSEAASDKESDNLASEDAGTPKLQHTNTPAQIKKRVVGDGGDLLFHTVAHAVPSAQTSLTTVFGMGTGVASLL